MFELTGYENKVISLGQKIASQKALKQAEENLLQKDEVSLLECQKRIELFEKASEFLNSFVSESRERVCKEFEGLVTKILQETFGFERYQFKIISSVKRGVVGLSFVLYDKLNKKELDIIESSGGGIADVVSCILGFAFLEISKPKNQGPLVLDEKGKFVSSDFQNNFYRLLSELSKKYKRQILLVTHHESAGEFADKVFVLKQNEKGEVII